MMRHSDIRISSDIRIGCRIVEKTRPLRGRKGQQRQEMGSVISSWAVWGQNKTQKCVCEQVSRANKGHNRQSDIRFPTESLFSKEVDSG